MKPVTAIPIFLGIFCFAGFLLGCNPTHGGYTGHGYDAAGVVDMGPSPPPSCPTSVSGTVYAPNGTLPLYNVVVYVPSAPLDPLPTGVTCNRCGTTLSGAPITNALSDYKGHFRLDKVPAGKNIPLVVQLGKWRRQVTIPEVKACQDNPLTDPNLTRLPKKQSEGNMPRVAVTLGGCDKISCMLPKVGIDASEFGVAGDNKAIHFYSTPGQSGPSGMSDATPLWSSSSQLARYDMAIFSCECYEANPDYPPSTKDPTSYQAVTTYLNMGGRIFTTDYQYTWYKYSPDPAMQTIGNIPGGAPGGANPVSIDTTFPKGKALADWMNYTMTSASYGSVHPDTVFDNFSYIDTAKARTYASSGATTHPRFMSINTPVGKPVDQQCGKAVHLDAHINSTDTIDASYPAGCSSSIKSGEAAFAFFFFDLSSCIQDESMPPMPPPIQ